MSRPYMSLKASDLRILLEAKSDDESFLEDLVAELARRKSQASRRLLVDASRLLAEASTAQPDDDEEEELEDDWEEDEDSNGNELEVEEAQVDLDTDAKAAPVRSADVELASTQPNDQSGPYAVESLSLEVGEGHHPTAARIAAAPAPSPLETPPSGHAEAPLTSATTGNWRQLQAVTDGVIYPTNEWDIAPPRIRPLQAARSEFEHQLHMAACEWDLDPAILIQSAADIQAREHWSDLLEPFEHQVKNLITFCRRAPVALIADDVGLGKTISAGLILSELMARGKVRRALIIVPKVSLLPQWQGELSERFRIKSSHARGNELRYLLTTDTDIVLTTYDSARNTMDEIAEAGFDMLILDEAHKLRNLHGTYKAPRTAQRFEEALKERTFRYVLMLTATPIQNRLWDLYSLISLLTSAKGHINPLGTPDEFAVRYIQDHRSTARRLYPGRRDEFRQILSQYMLRTRRDDANLVFPDRRLETIPAEGGQHEQELLRAVGTLIDGMNGLAQSSIAVSLMSSPHALVAQLRNMKARGTISAGDLKRIESIANRIPRSAKERVLVDFIRSLQKKRPDDWRLVIFTGRIETQTAIGLILEAEFGQGCIGYIRGSKHAANQAAIAGYTASPPRVHVIISTEAGSEGLNLQAGNVLVNFDLPWNPMVLEQRIGRVQRMGSTFGAVAIINLVLKGSVEEHVVDRLSSKLAVISSTLGDIEGILEALPGDAGDEEAFERKIRDLVVASLTGMDVEESVRKIQQSIESAKQIYEEEKNTVQQTLGRLDAMHDEGPRMPGLSLTEPRMTEQDFTLGALSLSEGLLETVDEDRWRFTRRGFAPEDVVFTQNALQKHRGPQGLAGGRKVSLYRAGQPAFERLAESWRRRSQHFVRNAQPLDLEQAAVLAEQWATGLGEHIEVESLDTSVAQATFDGELLIRSAASVAHDKYEKMLPVGVRSSQRDPVDRAATDAPEILETLPLDELEEEGASLTECIQFAVAHDSDLGQFCEFYLKRRKEECERAGDHTELRALNEESFTPRVSTTVIGADGVVGAIVRATVALRVEGTGPYACEVHVAPGPQPQLEAPDITHCAESGLAVPEACLLPCARSGAPCLPHHLQTSGLSGRQFRAEFLRTCAETEMDVADDEVGTSSVSGQSVRLDLLHSSAVSGKRALGRELAKCEFTDAWVLPKELATSEVSQKRFRTDEARTGGHASVRGHRSEFAQCEETSVWLLPGELETSDLSGKAFDSALCVTSEQSGRKGARSESGVCSVSNRVLLSDELGTCEVTEGSVGLDQLKASSRSGRLAAVDRIVKCQASGAELLPDEVAKCQITGKTVDERLLQESSVSSKRALKSECQRCASSGKYALPEELVPSAVSRKRVLPALLEPCAASGKLALAAEMEPDALNPTQRLIRSQGVFSEVSGRLSLPSNRAQCAWDGRTRLKDEVGTCVATQLTVGSEHLSPRSQLRSIETILRSTPPALQTWTGATLAQANLPGGLQHSDLAEAKRLPGPTGAASVARIKTKGIFGLGTKVFALVLDSDAKPLGRPVRDKDLR